MGNELPPYIMPKFRIANYNTNSDIILGIEIVIQGHAISNRKKIRINRKKITSICSFREKIATNILDDLNEGWGIEIYKDYFYNNIDHYANSGGYCYFIYRYIAH